MNIIIMKKKMNEQIYETAKEQFEKKKLIENVKV